VKSIQMNTEMKLIEDLGMRRNTPDCKTKERWGLYLCPICEVPFETRTTSVNIGRVSKCRSCSTSLKNIKHGETNTRLYGIWAKMKYRCSNPNNQAYKYYGARGITVCDEWKNDFISFRDWSFSNGYEEYLVLDKDIICEKENISPKIYSPKTCMWVTVAKNNSEMNKRREDAKHSI